MLLGHLNLAERIRIRGRSFFEGHSGPSHFEQKGEPPLFVVIFLMPVKPESELFLKHTQVTEFHPEPGQIILILLHYVFLENCETCFGTLEYPSTVSRPHLKAVIVMGCHCDGLSGGSS